MKNDKNMYGWRVVRESIFNGQNRYIFGYRGQYVLPVKEI
jgi:hypothetical protein